MKALIKQLIRQPNSLGDWATTIFDKQSSTLGGDGMMRTGVFTVRNFNAMLAGAALLTLLPSVGHAFTEADQQRLCTGDVFRLCSSEIPDRGRIIACMQRQRASLSEGCRSVFGRPSERSASAAGWSR